jgi:hypothetical protein|tara:strand:- start:32451 stop:37793 length:5343 start_codon:yes stop_codon:yes gene_type:complete
MERKKIVGTPFKTANGVNVGYDINVGFENSNKPLPTGEVIRIVSAGQQFEKERQESTKYRLTGNITPMIYYPQDFYWLGNQINNAFEFVTGATSSSQTNALSTQNYNLPNILTLNGPNPTSSQMEISNKDNWVGQILYPYENEYTLKYNIPQFNASKAYAADIEDSRFSIDTGIDNLVYQKISDYLDLMVNGITLEDWFIGAQFIKQEPIDYNQTLIIANQQFQGYVQDGVPFLFSIPIKTEQGWFTALYTPFPHNFEEGDYLFIKPLSSTGYNVSNNQYDTCDPSLYGFKRVIDTKWNSVLNNKNKYYVIIDHKTKYHEDWTTSAAPNSGSWKVRSSQGFIKRVKNYSEVGTLDITTELLLNTTFSIVPGGTMVTLLVIHELKKEDNILLTLGEDAVDTHFPNQIRPLLYNLSGTYEVTDIVNDYSFIIRSTELSDGIAYWEDQYTFGTLPQVTYITISKLNPYPSEYYLRKGKILTTINEFEVSKLPMSNSIYNDTNSNLVVEEDIDIKGLKDNLGRPISQLYLSLTKRAGKENYDFTDVETFFSWVFSFSQILVKTGDGLEIASKRCKDSDDYVGYVKDVTKGWMDAYGEFLGDTYYIDFTEYNKSTLEEKTVETLKHRFNTSYRECGEGICDEWLLDVRDNNFGGWGIYSNNSGTLTNTANNGAVLNSSNSWVGPIENNFSTGNFIEQSFIVTTSYQNQELYMTFEYTQVTSTGIVKILDPGGSQIISTIIFPGNAADIDGSAQQGTFSATFTPTQTGTHKILLGLSNYPETYVDVGGSTVTTSTFEGKYSGLQILKYYGTPQFSGWIYDPFEEYTIRRYSDFIEVADPKVLGVPDYATFIDGLWYWRDLLDVGYFEDIDFTIGVDYPFLNGKHYVDATLNLTVGLTPNQLGGTNGNGNTIIIFGCMDIVSSNYNPFATVPCDNDAAIQGGPCVNDSNGVMQSLVTNPLGCCCFYQLDPVNSANNTVFAVKTPPASVLGTGPQGDKRYDYGIQNSGYNRCNGKYPYWEDAIYFGQNNQNHPFLIDYDVSYDFFGVSVGVDNPVARFSRESGEATYDILTFQNYGASPAGVQNTLDVVIGDGAIPPNPTFGNDRGQVQVLFDPDNVFHSPLPPQNGNTTNGWKGSPGGLYNGDNLESVWPMTENIVTDPSGSPVTYNNVTNLYFDQTGILEFYKFDTTTCNTCFDKGWDTSVSPPVYIPSTHDYFAPRHNWPLLNPGLIGIGGLGNLDEFTNGNGVTMYIPNLWKGMTMGYNAGQSWTPQRRFENSNSGYGNISKSDPGSIGLINRDIRSSLNTNIVAHRRPTDPDNWSFFYAQCPSTWACWKINNFGDNNSSKFPGTATNPSQTTPSGGPTEANFLNFDNNCNTADANAGDDNCARYCGCLLPSGGQKDGGFITDPDGIPNPGGANDDFFTPNIPLSFGLDMDGGMSRAISNYRQNQPSYFEPIIPAGETHYHRFRGRVNIEMGINHDGFEYYKGNGNATSVGDAGWQFAGGAWGTYGGPPITYINSEWFGSIGNSGTKSMYLQWSNWLADKMSVPDGYMDYTRLYAGFWIAVVSETDKVTYIYDPDDGSNGMSTASSSKQSEGPGGSNGINWDIGCGGFKNDGITRAVNKMSYTPCNDHGGGASPNLSQQCGVSTLGGDGSNPCPGCTSIWNGTTQPFEFGGGNYDETGNHPRYDFIMAGTGRLGYVPSCGEVNSNSTKASFQKQWSQSFLSEEIPLKTGDKVFVYTRAVNGEFKTNWKGEGNQKSRVEEEINSGYDGAGNYLPSYIVAQLTQVV